MSLLSGGVAGELTGGIEGFIGAIMLGADYLLRRL